jgi:hypothetical protein
MEDRLHPVEAAWRQFRGGKNMALFRECIKEFGETIKAHGRPSLPAEVVLPGVVPFNLVPLRHGRSPFDQRDVKAVLTDEIVANSIQVWAAYRESKTIYQVETHLASCFAHTPWPDNAPVEALRLTLPLRGPGTSFRARTILFRRSI